MTPFMILGCLALLIFSFKGAEMLLKKSNQM